jgi:hypothetical protein
MGGAVNLHGWSDHHMPANLDLVGIQDGAVHIDLDCLAYLNILAITTVEGRLNRRILADGSQQLLQKALAFWPCFGEVVAAEQSLHPLQLCLQLRIQSVVNFSGKHFLFFGFGGHSDLLSPYPGF